MQSGRRGAYVIAHNGDPINGGGWSNQMLLKDCGIIPYLLHKNHGFRAVMVGSQLDKEYPYLEQLRGLELDFLSEDTIQARLSYVSEHASDMDLLILYGAYPDYIPLVEYYKHVRPDGKIYLATDMNIGWATRIPQEDPAYKKFLHSCDVIAASCQATQKFLSSKWSVPVDLIRNGWHNFFNISFDNLFEQKENIILTVGRVGIDIPLTKRTDILLEAFAKVAAQIPDWKLRLVGDIHSSFKPYMKNYFSQNPKLKKRVTFTGLIKDKVELANEYKRARIFCLTSPSEGGTPNVTAEALFAGNFMIFSAIDAAYEATDDNRCGRVFPIGDVDALAEILLEVCRDKDLLLRGGQHAVEYAHKNFDAEHIVAKLYYLLYGGDTK